MEERFRHGNSGAVVMAGEQNNSFEKKHKTKCWLVVKMPKMDMEAMKDGVNGSE